ncbi:Uncharacterised protein [uncultured archaeon]|nr:Uncharacterised protein [uncultured archaeon]
MALNKQILKDKLGWGILLWLIGYILGFIFYFLLPTQLIGWAILPIGTIITLWVLLAKIKATDLKYYLKLAVFWTLIAVVLDYLFIIKMLNPTDGYYKIDVYIYYALTFILPLAAGKWKQKK